MKKTSLCLVGFVLAFALVVESSSSKSSYDRMADVNRDKTVDVHDLSRLGRAYEETVFGTVRLRGYVSEGG